MCDKLKMHTPNKADENFKKLVALFMNAIIETIDEFWGVIRVTDKDILMQEIPIVLQMEKMNAIILFDCIYIIGERKNKIKCKFNFFEVISK